MGTAIGVEGAKSLPPRIQGQFKRTTSGDTGRVFHKNGPYMFALNADSQQFARLKCQPGKSTCRVSCELENFQGLQEWVRRPPRKGRDG